MSHLEILGNAASEVFRGVFLFSKNAKSHATLCFGLFGRRFRTAQLSVSHWDSGTLEQIGFHCNYLKMNEL
jgi:hypothetical protein